MSTACWPNVPFGEVMRPNKRPYLLGPAEDANLVGMRLYGQGPFHRELKMASKIQKKSHYVIRENDVIYNKLFAWKGTFGVVPAELDGMYVSDKFPTYELNTNLVDQRYLQWYFKYPPLWEQARQMSTGSAALSKLTLNPPRFLDLTIPLPPLEEQRSIALRINSLSTKIAEAQQLYEERGRTLTAIQKSVLRVMTERFGPLGRLADVLVSKPRNGWSARCDNAESGVPVLTLSAVTGYEFIPTAFKRTSEPTNPDAHYWLRDGDLLITRSNTPQLVGHAAIYCGEPKECIYPDLMMRIPINPEKAYTTFVWYWLQTPLARDFIERNAKGTSPTMKKISQGVVLNIPFPAELTLDRQHQVVEKITILQSRLRETSKCSLLAAIATGALLPAILDRAFKGELS